MKLTRNAYAAFGAVMHRRQTISILLTDAHMADIILRVRQVLLKNRLTGMLSDAPEPL